MPYEPVIFKGLFFHPYWFSGTVKFLKLFYLKKKPPRAYLSLKVFGCFFEVTQFGVKVFVTLLDEKQNVVLDFTSEDLLGALK